MRFGGLPHDPEWWGKLPAMTRDALESEASTNGAGRIPVVTLGWRMRMAMEAAGVTAYEIADDLGVHRGTITRWTHDVGGPPKRTFLRRWAEVTAVPYDWLVDGPSPEEA